MLIFYLLCSAHKVYPLWSKLCSRIRIVLSYYHYLYTNLHELVTTYSRQFRKTVVLLGCIYNWAKYIPYMNKYSRDVLFKVLVVNWPSARFSSSKFHWWTVTCMNQRAGYLVILKNKIAKCLICDILKIYMPQKFVHMW